MFVLVYSNQDKNSIRYIAKKYYLPKSTIKSYNITNGKNFYDQLIDSNKILYEQIRKLATGQGEDLYQGCFLHYE